MQASELSEGIVDPTAVFTVLAPTDTAFGFIPAEDIQSLLASTPALNLVCPL